MLEKQIIFRKGGPRNHSNYTFKYNDLEIEIVSEYNYLGMTFYHSDVFDRTAKSIISKSRLAMSSVFSLIYRNKIDSWKVVMRLFSAMVSSVLLYAAPIWSLRYLTNIEIIQTQFLKKVLNLAQNTPNCCLRLETNSTPLAVTVFKNSIRWVDNLNKMDGSRYPKICFERLKDYARKYPKSNSKYNWVLQLKEKFFDHLDILNFEEFLIDDKIKKNETFLLNNLQRYYTREDITKFKKTSSIIFNSILEYEKSQPAYFDIIEATSIIKILCQIRICNTHNQRIIIKNKIFRIRPDEYCFCCNAKVDLFHLLNDCILFEDIRIKYFNEKESVFVNKLANVNKTLGITIIYFLNEVLERYNFINYYYYYYL